MTRRHPDSLTSRGLIAMADQTEFGRNEFLRTLRGGFETKEEAAQAANEMQATGLTERVVRLTDKGRAALQIVQQLRDQQ